jgi:hypothetical protein
VAEYMGLRGKAGEADKATVVAGRKMQSHAGNADVHIPDWVVNCLVPGEIA